MNAANHNTKAFRSPFLGKRWDELTEEELDAERIYDGASDFDKAKFRAARDSFRAESAAREPHPGWVDRPQWFAHPGDDRGPLTVFRPSPKKAVEGDKPEFEQIQPSEDLIASKTSDLIQYTHHLVANYPGFGQRHFAIAPNNLLSPSTREALTTETASTVRAMMGGKPPTPKVINTAVALLLAHAFKGGDIPLIRWAGETSPAMHEIPRPVEGDWSAHKEFTDRCSCPDTVMAWTWSCFLPENQTGREALLLKGEGHDGKSYWAEALMRFLGPVAASAEILKGENRFELANLLAKRLAYFGDFRNPRPIHSKIMRELISGAFLAFERKGHDMEQGYFHPRVLLTTNVEPRIIVTDRAEYTRIRRVNVRTLVGNQGDRTWPIRLLEQMPAFLFECRKVYQRMVPTGKDIPITQACHDALAGGSAALEEEFEYLSLRLALTGKETDFVTSKRMSDLFKLGGYTLKPYAAENARAWLRSGGATNRTPDGKQIFKKIAGKATAVWRGVRESESGVFSEVSSAQESRA